MRKKIIMLLFCVGEYGDGVMDFFKGVNVFFVYCNFLFYLYWIKFIGFFKRVIFFVEFFVKIFFIVGVVLLSVIFVWVFLSCGVVIWKFVVEIFIIFGEG